jgi:D-alanyl-D-alanine carboxypeptidase (penicillin-binding protein 5/6)
VRVWKGRVRSLVPVVQPPPLVAVRKDQGARLRTSREQGAEIVAPVSAGQVVGQITVSIDGEVIARFPLKAGIDVARAGVFRRAADTLILFLRGLFSRPGPD